MANEALAQTLREMAFFAELRGENPFKIRAWQNSALSLEERPEDAATLVQTGEIARIPGIGKGTQALVKEFVETGKLQEHDELKSHFPAGITELLEVRGLGPKKIKALYDQLGIGSLTELEYACNENRLVELKGFGEKTQTSVLQNIEKIKANRGKSTLPAALHEAERVKDSLLALPGAERVEETGELRRLLPVQSRLDFLVAGKEAELSASLPKAGFTRLEDGSWRRTVPDHLAVVVQLASKEDFGARWLETTGPMSFLQSLGEIPRLASEAEVFATKKRTPLPPESRDLGAAPKDLIREEDIRGVFHLHTNWSDGKNTLEEMAAAAVELGYEYLGVSEHSQSAFYAHGLSEERVTEQRREIDRLQAKFPSLRIFHGIESDILADGSLDYPAPVLKRFDFVIASVHGQMRMPRAEMTKRLCRALENPATTWLGHWSGRLLLGREGYEFDEEAVLKTAAQCGKSLELNSNPYRLDADWSVLPAAARLGIPIGIFPDAHSTGGLEDVRYGVMMARKAGLRASEVVNTKSLQEMEKWLQKRK